MKLIWFSIHLNLNLLINFNNTINEHNFSRYGGTQQVHVEFWFDNWIYLHTGLVRFVLRLSLWELEGKTVRENFWKRFNFF